MPVTLSINLNRLEIALVLLFYAGVIFIKLIFGREILCISYLFRIFVLGAGFYAIIICIIEEILFIIVYYSLAKLQPFDEISIIFSLNPSEFSADSAVHQHLTIKRLQKRKKNLNVKFSMLSSTTSFIWIDRKGSVITRQLRHLCFSMQCDDRHFSDIIFNISPRFNVNNWKKNPCNCIDGFIHHTLREYIYCNFPVCWVTVRLNFACLYAHTSIGSCLFIWFSLARSVLQAIFRLQGNLFWPFACAQFGEQDSSWRISI